MEVLRFGRLLEVNPARPSAHTHRGRRRKGDQASTPRRTTAGGRGRFVALLGRARDAVGWARPFTVPGDCFGGPVCSPAARHVVPKFHDSGRHDDL